MLLLVSWPLLQHLLSLFRGVRRCLDASEPSNGSRDMSSANDLQHPQKIQHFLTGPVSQQRLSLFFSARLLWIFFLCFERAEHTVPFCQNSPSKNIQIFIFFGSHCPAMQCRVHPLITPDGLYGFPELYSGTMSRSIWANQDIKDIQKQSNTFKNIKKKRFFIQELSAFPNMLAGVIKFSVQPESLSFIQ